MSRRYRSNASNIHTAIWLIGIGILWLTNMWWPGILILVGISMLVRVMVPRADDTPPAVITAKPEVEEAADVIAAEEMDPWEADEEETPAFMRSDPEMTSDKTRLPEQCPACGGPVAENAHKVEWAGPVSASCPFCNTPLTLLS